MSSIAQQKVAIITGGATGMGNAVALDLAHKNWKVVILDYNSEEGKAAAAKAGGDFYLVDVRSWKQQFEAFAATFEKYGRVDFVFGNAGKADVKDHFDFDSAPLKADTTPTFEVLDINLIGTSYTTLLAMNAFRRNPAEVTDSLLVLTSSGAGLYPTGVQPFYAAAKHGVIGLARSTAGRFRTGRIRICALVPGLVPTPIMPKEIIERTDKSIVTPVSHIVTAVNDMLHNRRNGTVCEASVDQLFFRDPPDFPDEAQRKVILEVCDSMEDDFKRVRQTNTGHG